METCTVPVECGACRQVVHGDTIVVQPCCRLRVCPACLAAAGGRCPICHHHSLRARTKLHDYAATGDHRKVRKHLARGLLVDKRDERGWAPLHFVLFGALTTFASGLHLVFENFDFEGEGEELNDEEGDDGDEGEGESEAPSKQAFLRCLFFSACVAVAVNGVVKLMTYDTPHLQVTALPVGSLQFDGQVDLI